MHDAINKNTRFNSQVFYLSPPYFITEKLRVMAVQVLWILLALVEVVHSDQPVFVPTAAELSDALPENKQDWLHPVIFEPQNKIQLTHSTYQVTTFLDFASFMNGFRNVQNYIKSFKADVSNPAYFSKIKHKSTNKGTSPLLYEQDLEVSCSHLIVNNCLCMYDKA